MLPHPLMNTDEHSIVHVMASGECGGGATHLLELLPALKKNGISCSAIVGDNGPLLHQLIEKGISAFPIQLMSSRYNIFSAAKLASAIKNTGASIVHYHGTRAAFFGAIARASGMLKIPAFYTVHVLAHKQKTNVFKRYLLKHAEFFSCQHANRIFCVSPGEYEYLKMHFKKTPSIVYIGPHVADRFFKPVSDQNNRIALGIDEQTFVVGTVARLVPQKATHQLILACADLPVQLMIVGDGPLRNSLEQLAQQKMKRPAIFVGEQQNVEDFLSICDAFALSTEWEAGLPLSLLEAMAIGLPCVCTHLNDMYSSQENKQSLPFLTYPKNDMHALRQIILQFVENKQEAQQLGLRARLYAKQHYQHQQLRHLLNAYQNYFSNSHANVV